MQTARIALGSTGRFLSKPCNHSQAAYIFSHVSPDFVKLISRHREADVATRKIDFTARRRPKKKNLCKNRRTLFARPSLRTTFRGNLPTRIHVSVDFVASHLSRTPFASTGAIAGLATMESHFGLDRVRPSIEISGPRSIFIRPRTRTTFFPPELLSARLRFSCSVKRGN